MKAAMIPILLLFLYGLGSLLLLFHLILLNPIIGLCYAGLTIFTALVGIWYTGKPKHLTLVVTSDYIPDLSPLFEEGERSLCDLAEGLDEEMEKRFGQKRCRTCG